MGLLGVNPPPQGGSPLGAAYAHPAPYHALDSDPEVLGLGEAECRF